MSTIKDGGPAFPGGVNQVYTNIEPGEPTQSGMTLRDYFAAKAMQALATANIAEIADANGVEGEPVVDYMARAAYHVADAMLAAREVQS